jgi:hypothetical protein
VWCIGEILGQISSRDMHSLVLSPFPEGALRDIIDLSFVSDVDGHTAFAVVLGQLSFCELVHAPGLGPPLDNGCFQLALPSEEATTDGPGRLFAVNWQTWKRCHPAGDDEVRTSILVKARQLSSPSVSKYILHDAPFYSMHDVRLTLNVGHLDGRHQRLRNV